MGHAIGARIRKLREERKMSQDDVAAALGTTRQRLSRIENEQVDVSYLMLKQIAGCLGVSVDRITKAAEESKGFTALFRDKSDSPQAIAAVQKIEEILKVFHAHEKLYEQMKERASR